MTYRDLRRAVSVMHRRLIEAGIGPDDRVAVIAGNDPAFVVAYLAILRAGAVAVPLNIVSPPAELQHQLDEVSVSAILVGPGGDQSLSGAPVIAVDGLPGGQADELVADELEAVERRPEDVAALLFTAGTAGAPRAAMLSHGNLLANLDQVQRHPGRALNAGDRILGVLPLCHIFGLNVVLGGTLYAGASVVMVERFDAAHTLELIAAHQVTVVLGAPSLFAALVGVGAEAGTQPMGSVRMAYSGAAPLPIEVAEAFEMRYQLPLLQGYGLTEASPVVTSAIVDQPVHPGSIGVPLPGLELRLVDEDGEDTLAGDPGEIWVRGPNVFPGYWRDTAATEAVLTGDGWLRTGDIAVVGDDGELAIVDRAKDLIIVSGFNVFPAEVEGVLIEHPGVQDAAVIGDADATRGEVVHAFVVSIGDVGATELQAWCRDRLARYKCPAVVTFVPSLPHGLAGKLLRRSLRTPT